MASKVLRPSSARPAARRGRFVLSCAACGGSLIAPAASAKRPSRAATTFCAMPPESSVCAGCGA
eukprot:2471802-Alexandrium_andersonii.AAC.1